MQRSEIMGTNVKNEEWNDSAGQVAGSSDANSTAKTARTALQSDSKVWSHIDSRCLLSDWSDVIINRNYNRCKNRPSYLLPTAWLLSAVTFPLFYLEMMLTKMFFFLHLLKIAFLSITRTDGILQPPAKRNGCVIWVIALLKMYFYSTTFFFF